MNNNLYKNIKNIDKFNKYNPFSNQIHTNLQLFFNFTFFVLVVLFMILPNSIMLLPKLSSLKSPYKIVEQNPKCNAINVDNPANNDTANNDNSNNNNFDSSTKKGKMSIVIDDFGSFDQSGVELLLSCDAIITCAVIPFTDNTKANIEQIKNSHHELILHMPMEAHVYLPESWYGEIYIKKSDNKEIIENKLKKCLEEFPEIRGLNIHIGSGVSQNKEIMKTIYNFCNANNLYFLDSRTIITNGTTDACKETDSVYLGRDVFLEADKNRTYSGVCKRLIEGANIAKEKGYSIVIGHVGAEGGENTAKAIYDSILKIKSMGVEIVPLSQIYDELKK